jgi:histidine triad (HIT) family protein
MKKMTVTIGLLLLFGAACAQQKSVEEYQAMKEKKLLEKSPFEKIIAGELPRNLVFEDDYVVAFVPLKPQAPVHYLIVPKKRINTVNDITDADVVALGHLFLAAKAVAEKFGISETGYRLAINTNRDAGQSEFHIHMHLLGGVDVGPMMKR